MRLPALALLALCAPALLACGSFTCERPGAFPPPAAGMARLYVFRPPGYELPDWTTVSLNGERLGDSGPGTVFHRDVPPGRYEIEVRSERLYPDQFKTVAIGPGSTTYVEVDALPHWGQTGFGRPGATFAVTIADPASAPRTIAALCLTP
ncbi:MAG TPA: hypothetical protein VE397_15240 [Stellaceae bacterium]|nr:hypothetical protein [Stellaceae bacterium]